MADMMKASTSYALLDRKYDGFDAPTIAITIDGRDIIAQCDAAIGELTIDLTSRFEASGCTFEVYGAYDSENTRFDQKSAVPLLQVGAQVEVSLGYGNARELVFFGYISSMTYILETDEEASPYVHVECMDAKGILMKTQRLSFFTEKKPSGAVRALLGAQPCKGYLKGDEVEEIRTGDMSLRASMESDYDFIVRMAQRFGCEFFIVQGKAYFRQPPKSSAPIMTLKPDEALLSGQLRIDAAPLVQKVTVMGIGSENGKAIKGEAVTRARHSTTASAQRLLSGTGRIFHEPDITSASEAQQRADVILNSLSRDFMLFRGVCPGLPELVPGRTVKVEGLSAECDRSYYLTTVRHIFDDDGFYTSWEGRCDSL